MKAGTFEILAIVYALAGLGALIYFINVPSALAMLSVIIAALWSAENSIIAAIKRKGDE